MSLLTLRPRRLRRTPLLLDLVSETALSSKHLIYPLFVTEGKAIKREIPSLPQQYLYSPDTLEEAVATFVEKRIRNFLLFGVSEEKDFLGTPAYKEGNIVAKTIDRLKRSFQDDILITADVCLCQFTDHGHCGIPVEKDGRFVIDNDRTLPLLNQAAVSYARSGADLIAPSDMMDGRVASLRQALDENGFSQTPIMSYSAKYASSFYGPFRDAAGSAPQFGDRTSYQLSFKNRREALREMALDVKEGADIVMVKPALAYLDIIAQARERFDVPLAAYSVSGEYALLKQAARSGLIDEKRGVLEVIYAIRRAGADLIITYWTPELTSWLCEM